MKVDPLDIFACWCTYPPVSVLLFEEAGFNPKALFLDVVRRTYSNVFEYEILPLRKKKFPFPEKKEHLRCLFVTATAFVVVFWLKLFLQSFFSSCKVTRKVCMSVNPCGCVRIM